jgi:DNA replication protein DnaC
MSAALRLVADVPPAPEPVAPPRPPCEWSGGDGCGETLPVDVEPAFSERAGGWAWIDSALLCPTHAPIAGRRRERACLDRQLFAAGIPRRFLGVDVAELELAGSGERQLATRLPAWMPGELLPVISGTAASGKTTWAAVLARSAIEAGRDVAFIDEPTLKEVLHREMGSSARGSVVDDLVQAEVVILDDLGGLRRPSDWYWDKVEYVVYQRWARELPLLVTLPAPKTGSALQHLAAQAGERLVSLLFDSAGGLEVRLADGNRRFAAGEVRRG